MTRVERLHRRAVLAQALTRKATTVKGLSAANDTYLRCLVDFFHAAGRLGAVDVWRDSETRRVANSK
jgi:hypothetical protein